MKSLTKEQMAKIDRIVVDKYDLQIKQMMENAGRNVARWIFNNLHPKKAIIIFGKGNNGGDGLCCARHLSIYGVSVEIVRAFEGSGNNEVENQLKIINESGSVKEISEIPNLNQGDVIVDALLGYNVSGNPREKFAELIKKANFYRKKGVKIISYDLPSGMNPDTGTCADPCIEADYTITLGLPKNGLKNEEAGEIWLANLGIPNEVYEKELGIKIENYFKGGDVVRI